MSVAGIKAVTELVWDVSLDGCDHEFGDVDNVGWSGYIEFDQALAQQVFIKQPGGRCCWFPNDGTVITGFSGARIEQDSNGFKYSTLFEDSTEYEEALFLEEQIFCL